MDSGSAKNAVRNDGAFFDFHLSQAVVQPTGVNRQGFWPSSLKDNGTAVMGFVKFFKGNRRSVFFSIDTKVVVIQRRFFYMIALPVFNLPHMVQANAKHPKYCFSYSYQQLRYADFTPYL